MKSEASGDEHFDKDFCLGYSYYTCHGGERGSEVLSAASPALLTNNPSGFLLKRDLFLPSSDHEEKKSNPPKAI